MTLAAANECKLLDSCDELLIGNPIQRKREKEADRKGDGERERGREGEEGAKFH